MGYENYQEIFDLIKRCNNLAFLIGAGCSSNPPSNLPTGKLMMEELIKYFCYKPVQKDLLTLLNKDKIRFEKFMELVQSNFDSKLKTLEFYSNCKSPNKTHLFLADKIINGNEVFTTNFDNLIEEALILLSKNKDKIRPVITEADFNEV